MAEPSHVAVLRYRFYDHDLRCERTGVYGYRALCRCGWRGERRDGRDLAAADLHWHKQDRHAALDEAGERL